MSLMMSNNQARQSIPRLRYHDQTPLRAPSDKRPFSYLSPCEELQDVSKTISDAVNQSPQDAIPTNVETLQSQLKATIQSIAEESIRTLKQEIINELRAKIQYSDKMNNLKALSEAELFETYNRGENLRIFGLPEETTQSIDGKTSPESFDETNKLVTLAGEMGAAVDKNDITIAHRLLSRSKGHRPVIVRFSRRVAKVDLLEKRKNS